MNVMERREAILTDGLTPEGPGRDRRADARYDSSARVVLSWRERCLERETSGRLVDVSLGGAALVVDDSPPVSITARVRLVEGANRGWIEAEILDDGPKVRLRFLRRWSMARLEALLFGDRTRRRRGQARFARPEALEGRELMSTVPASVSHIMGPTVAKAPAPAPGGGFLAIATDSFLSKVLYSTPGRMASQIAADGAIGVNSSWENGQSASWYIEQQRYGADFVQAGLQTGNTALVQQGWQILNWGFAHEAANGSFPGTGDAFHSTSMFVEAGARALLLEVQSGAPNASQLVATYLPKINASAQWLMNPTVAAKGNANDAPYSHRAWLLAAGLGEVAALTGDPATAAAAEAYAVKGLSLQQPDGMNPELGGGDASYQTYGILLAERYLAVCPDAALSSRIRTMIVKGLAWEENFIDANGQISLAGSTRTPVEVTWTGTAKTIDYKTIIQAFSVATTLTGDPSYRVVAQQVALGRGWKIS